MNLCNNDTTLTQDRYRHRNPPVLWALRGANALGPGSHSLENDFTHSSRRKSWPRELRSHERCNVDKLTLCVPGSFFLLLSPGPKDPRTGKTAESSCKQHWCHWPGECGGSTKNPGPLLPVREHLDLIQFSRHRCLKSLQAGEHFSITFQLHWCVILYSFLCNIVFGPGRAIRSQHKSIVWDTGRGMEARRKMGTEVKMDAERGVCSEDNPDPPVPCDLRTYSSVHVAEESVCLRLPRETACKWER